LTKPFPLPALALVLLAASTLPAQTLSVDQQSMTFTAQVHGTPTAQTLNVSSAPASSFVYATAVENSSPSINWLGVSPSAGPAPLALTVTVDPSNLVAGSYTGSIVISACSGAACLLTVPVTVTVSTIYVSQASISFQTAVGNVPWAQSVGLASSQAVSFTVTAATTSGGNWLQVSPAAGSLSGSNYGTVSAIPYLPVVSLLSPATYNGSITITPTNGSSLTPIVIPVTLTVLPAPPVTVSPATVSLNYQIGGANNTPQQTVTLSTTSAQGVGFTFATPAVPWVSPNPASGAITTSGTPVSIGYNTGAALAAGTYQTTLTLDTPNGSPTTTSIPVALFVSSLPLLNVPTATLAFSAELSGSSPAAQSVTITSTSAAAQQFNVTVSTTSGGNWLTAPTSGSTSSPLAISVNSAGLAPGTYTGAVTVTGVGTGNSAQQIPVTLKIYNDPAVVSNFASLAMAYQTGQAQPPSQVITVSSSNGVPLSYSATASTSTCGSGWLPLGGATSPTGQITVSINPLGLGVGSCKGTVLIQATNSLTGNPAINSPLVIPVTVTVATSALLVVSPLTPAVFSAQAGGTAQGPLPFTLTSTNTDQLNYTVAASTTNGGSGWLQISQTNGNTASCCNKLGISVQPGQLAAGAYTGTVTVTATGPTGAAVGNSPLTIPVTFTVTNGSLVLGQTAISFKQAANGPPPTNQVVTVTSTLLPLNFAASAYTSDGANWLTVSPAGATPGSISIGVDGSKLAQGSYTGTVVVLSTTANAGNSPAFLSVTLVVNAGAITAVPASFIFTEVQGGPAPAAQNLTLSGTPGAIPFQATANTGGGGSWLSTSPISGSTPGTLQVTIAANSLAAGSYNGNVTIVAPGADGSPITIPVTLNVLTPDQISVTPTTVNFTASAGATTSQSAQLQVFAANGSTSFSVVAPAGSFFTVSPTNGATPAQVTVTVIPTGLANGAYSGTFNISSPNSISTVQVTVNLVVGTAPLPQLNAVANAASYSTGQVAPGENVVIFGNGIGPPTLTIGTVTNGVVNPSAGATRVLFDGIPAPVIYALSTQTSVMAPYEIAGRASTNIVVEYQGVQSLPVAYNITLTAPGIYTQNQSGTGPGAIRNQDYSLNLPGTPAAKGSVVAVYMSGEGDTVGAVDGAIATGLLYPVLPVTATIGGIPAAVLYAGTAPGIVTGAMQVNIKIPATAPSGPAVPLVITVGTGTTAASTQAGVTIAVQ
jgi:uncharacterized protein (TIGR03437 family)